MDYNVPWNILVVDVFDSLKVPLLPLVMDELDGNVVCRRREDCNRWQEFVDWSIKNRRLMFSSFAEWFVLKY